MSRPFRRSERAIRVAREMCKNLPVREPPQDVTRYRCVHINVQMRGFSAFYSAQSSTEDSDSPAEIRQPVADSLTSVVVLVSQSSIALFF
jgi:hypothetical protein